jgi:hypothetical protein
MVDWPLASFGSPGSKCADCQVVCTWAQNERPADLRLTQPNVPVSMTGQFRLLDYSAASGDAGGPHSCYDRQVNCEHLMFFCVLSGALGLD